VSGAVGGLELGEDVVECLRDRFEVLGCAVADADSPLRAAGGGGEQIRMCAVGEERGFVVAGGGRDEPEVPGSEQDDPPGWGFVDIGGVGLGGGQDAVIVVGRDAYGVAGVVRGVAGGEWELPEFVEQDVGGSVLGIASRVSAVSTRAAARSKVWSVMVVLRSAKVIGAPVSAGCAGDRRGGAVNPFEPGGGAGSGFSAASRRVAPRRVGRAENAVGAARRSGSDASATRSGDGRARRAWVDRVGSRSVRLGAS
jgi:hypothetical protein